MSIVIDAMKFAGEKHSGQIDDQGKDYFSAHVMVVLALIEKVAPNDSNLQAAAILHDTIEDTETTYDELVEKFNKDVADLVMEVTHEKDEKYGYYFPRLKTQRAIILKFMDRAQNLSRMEVWNEKRRESYLRKSKFWKSSPGD